MAFADFLQESKLLRNIARDKCINSAAQLKTENWQTAFPEKSTLLKFNLSTLSSVYNVASTDLEWFRIKIRRQKNIRNWNPAVQKYRGIFATGFSKWRVN